MLVFDNNIIGTYSVDGSRLFSEVHSDMTGGKGLKLWHGKFWLDISKKICTMRVIKYQKTLPREVVQFVVGNVQVFSVSWTLPWGNWSNQACFELGVRLDNLWEVPSDIKYNSMTKNAKIKVIRKYRKMLKLFWATQILPSPSFFLSIQSGFLVIYWFAIELIPFNLIYRKQWHITSQP